MLTVGDKLPEFKLKACVSLKDGAEFDDISNDSFSGKWKVLFFWPMDFTFVCPTEIEEFAASNSEFSSRDAVVLGASTDSHYVHLAWRNADSRLAELPFPMLADIKRELSQALGILHEEDQIGGLPDTSGSGHRITTTMCPGPSSWSLRVT